MIRYYLATAVFLCGCGAVKDNLPGDVGKKVNQAHTAVKEGFVAIKNLGQELTPENEYWVGRAVATNILAKNDYKYLDAEAFRRGELVGMSLYLNEIANVIVAAALQTARDGDRPAPLAGWHVVVVDSEAINATAAPGGFLFVTTGAVRLAKSEDELAAVLAHEVAHVIRGHALGTIKKAKYANISKDLLTKSGQLSGEELSQLTALLEGALDDMIDALFVKGYSKDTEFEADALGAELTAAAGYDPRALTAYLNRLAKNQDTGDGGFYATHPSASDRISRLAESVPRGDPVVPSARQRRFKRAVATM